MKAARFVRAAFIWYALAALMSLGWRSCGSMIALRWRSEGVRVALDYRSLAILGTGRRLLDLSPTGFFTSVCLGTARVFA